MNDKSLTGESRRDIKIHSPCGLRSILYSFAPISEKREGIVCLYSCLLSLSEQH
jgi:hypothetical protein